MYDQVAVFLVDLFHRVTRGLTLISFYFDSPNVLADLRFRVGEGRAYWSLGNAYTALNRHDIALEYAEKHLIVSKEVSLSALVCIVQLANFQIQDQLTRSDSPLFLAFHFFLPLLGLFIGHRVLSST